MVGQVPTDLYRDLGFADPGKPFKRRAHTCVAPRYEFLDDRFDNFVSALEMHRCARDCAEQRALFGRRVDPPIDRDVSPRVVPDQLRQIPERLKVSYRVSGLHPFPDRAHSLEKGVLEWGALA